jgi:autotransporter passenger strand-loop-strand repeat protein
LRVTQRVLRGGLELLSGGTATGTVVMSSGGQGITRNGVAINTVVSSGGQQALGGSGTPIASGTTVLSGGLLLVGTGQAVSAVVSSGGSVSVGDLGSAQGTTVFSGGSQTVAGHASGTVLSGGFEYVSGPNAVQLLALVDDGGAEYVLSGAQLASALMSGGAIVIDSGGLASGSIALVSGAFGAVQLNGTGNLGGEVSGFDTTDTFDFRTIGFTDDITALSWTQLASGGSASGTLTLASGGTSASLTLLGQYAGKRYPSTTARPAPASPPPGMHSRSRTTPSAARLWLTRARSPPSTCSPVVLRTRRPSALAGSSKSSPAAAPAGPRS